MDDAEQELFHDDHVEITDLPEETEAAGRLRTSRGKARIAPPFLEKWLFRRQFTPRQRLLQVAAITGSVVLIALIVLAGSANTRNALITGIVGRQPTPTPTLFPGTDLFYIQGSPAWGHASLDGHVLSRLPIIGKDQPLRLTRGNHIVRWNADPFQPQTCLIAIPALVGSNSCVSHQVAQLKPNLFASIITFSESLDSLPENQFQALTRATQMAVNTLQSTEMVLPGEQYIDIQSNSGTATASEQMRATLNFQLDIALASTATCVSTLGRSVIPSCQDCRRFCTAPDQVFPASPTNQAWSVLALISATWKFTTLDGHIVEQAQPDSTDEHFIELQITWDGKNWHVKVPVSTLENPVVGNPICESAQQEIGTNGYFGATGGNVEEAVFWQQFVSETNLAAGCLAVGAPQQSTADQPHLPVAYLLYRFGVVVAGNQAAYRYWASQPLADTYEQHLIQQMAAQSPLQ
jgi:hypothetical protein